MGNPMQPYSNGAAWMTAYQHAPWRRQDIPHVVAWLVSDEAQRVTSAAVPVDAGCLLK